ncbi:alkene reductase [Kitasatospora sp. NPDC087314]|uniref:alkene reductase n=1 Tax=Kitasatospora sp. NPDC087314 TaxID=3364068 RepID=UPI003802BC28
MATLFDDITMGHLTLPNRIAMAPLTRNRADREGIPGPSAATYYAQRASAAVIITEGSQPSAAGQGFVRTPGLHSTEQLRAWRTVTDAVHAADGRIFAQIMHTGRIGHPDLVRHSSLPAGFVPLAPSAVRPTTGTAQTYDGPKEYTEPRAMTAAEVRTTIADFATAAANAIAAGFDGVELHGANGCLLHQFLASGSNRRTDGYGGPVAGRIRFTREVTEAVADAVGAERVGLRLSPGNRFNDIEESDTEELYCALVESVRPLGLGYLHLYETGSRDVTRVLRRAWPGVLMLSPHVGGRAPAGLAEGEQALADGVADVIAFGRNFIANPDLPERLRTGAPLNTPDPSTFYDGDDRGYTDYPALATV